MTALTDLEICRACARAMGWRTGGLASEAVAFSVSKHAIIAGNAAGGESVYDPLTYKSQAMDLVIALGISSDTFNQGKDWAVWYRMQEDDIIHGTDLLRAIATCAAKIQLAREKGEA